MINLGNYGLFLMATLTLCATPGPNMLFVLATGTTAGPRGGAIGALGIGIGNTVHAVAATLGLAALIASSPTMLTAIRIAGGAYLLFLGWRTIAARNWAGATQRSGPADTAQILRRATITSILNPKVAIFYVAFLPQFVDASRGAVTAQLAFLGATYALLGATFNAFIGICAGTARRFIEGNRGLVRALVVLVGSALFVWGLRVLLVGLL